MKRPDRLTGAILVCVLSLTAMTAALLLTSDTQQGQFTPPPFESAAQTGMPEVPKNLGYSELDAKAFKTAVCGVFAPEENCVDLWLTNPEENSVWLKLRVMDEAGTVLGETGLLRPGEYVRSLTLNTTPHPGAKVTLKLMAYEPDTYYSAGVVSLHTLVS